MPAIDYATLQQRLNNPPVTIIDDWPEFVHPHARQADPGCEWQPSFRRDRLFEPGGEAAQIARDNLRWLMLAVFLAAEQAGQVYARVLREWTAGAMPEADLQQPGRQVRDLHATLFSGRTGHPLPATQDPAAPHVYIEVASRWLHDRPPESRERATRMAHDLAFVCADPLGATETGVANVTALWAEWIRSLNPATGRGSLDEHDPLFRRLRQHWWNLVTSRLPFREGPLAPIEWMAPLAIADETRADGDPVYQRAMQQHARGQTPLRREADPDGPDGPVILRTGRAVKRERLLGDDSGPVSYRANRRRDAQRRGLLDNNRAERRRRRRGT